MCLEKVKEAFNIQQSLHNQVIRKKSIVFRKIEKSEIEMNRLNKILMQICRQ